MDSIETHNRILKDCPKEQWKDDWYESVERYVDYRFSNKTAEQSQQDYIQKRYKNRFKEAKIRKETETQKRKLKRRLRSKQFKEFLKIHYKKVDKANYNERLEYSIKLKDNIEERKFFLINEISAELKKKGKNPNHANTNRGIIQRVNKKIVEEFGIHPDNIENKSIVELEKILFADYDKPARPSLAEQYDTWIFDKPDDQLSPIQKLGKHDPVLWTAISERYQRFLEAKKDGHVGMYKDSYGVFR